MFWTYRSVRLQRFRQMSVLHFEALFFATANSGRCRRGFWGPSAFKRRIQFWAFCNRSAFKSDAVEKHDFFFANIVLRKWSPVIFVCVPPWNYREMVSMFLLSCFLEHLLRLVEHHLSFRSTVFETLLNLSISCFWLMSLRNCSLCWCFSNVSISFVTSFCRRASCIFTVEIEKQVFHGLQCCFGFPVALRFLLKFPRWSCFLYWWILWTAWRISSENNTLSHNHAFPLIKLILGLHAYRFLNEPCKQCVIEENCIRPCVIKLQSSLLSELQIAPKYCILKAFPNVFVWRGSCLCYIA